MAVAFSFIVKPRHRPDAPHYVPDRYQAKPGGKAGAARGAAARGRGEGGEGEGEEGGKREEGGGERAEGGEGARGAMTREEEEAAVREEAVRGFKAVHKNRTATITYLVSPIPVSDTFSGAFFGALF
eukprot:1143822-Rhodomonas_salina.5